jgi:PilZ domain
MNILQALLSLDADAIASIQSKEGFEHSGAKPAVQQGSATWHVLRAVQQEVETGATFVAVSASISNALSTELDGRMSASALLTYAPPKMPILAAALPRLIDGGELPEIVRSCQDFEARVSLARRMALAYADESSRNASKKTVNLSALQDALAHACNSAVEFLEALNAQTGRSAEGSTRNRPLLDRLASAAQGHHPCVEEDGCIVIPGWAERRRHKRQAIDIKIEILTKQGVFLARAFDVSCSGFGLAEIPGAALGCLTLGNPLRLKVPDGRVLSGTVAWVTTSKAGVQLSPNLSSNDPILLGEIGSNTSIPR